MAFALFNGTESAFIYDTLKGMGREHEYQRIYGRAWAINMVAAIAGTLIGAPLAAATSLSLPIVLSGGIAVLAAVTALSFREPPRVQTPLGRLSYAAILGQSAEIVRRRPDVRYAILFVGVVAIGSIGPIFFFQPFLRRAWRRYRRGGHLANADADRGDIRRAGGAADRDASWASGGRSA